MSRPRDYQPGESVPGTVYRVVRLIGAGGMGTVYDVEDTTVGKRYVLKTLHRELHKRQDLAQRMMKEARQLARLSHPNIVEVVTAGVTADDDGLPYYVMEKLNGQSLHTVLQKKGSLELPHALHIAIDLLDALDNAHEKGVVHRDVKPDNIFLHINPNGLTTTKLLDFGIMRVLDEPGVTAGRFMGTLRYAAPEQLRGEPPLAQTDLYAVGLVLFEMIAGRGPFDDEGESTRIAAAHLNATPPPVGQWGAVVPDALERLVRGALSKDPLRRPKDAFTFAAQLRNMNRLMAIERPSSATSRPTAVPIVGPETLASIGSAAPEPADALAATEHASTRAGTPDAKAIPEPPAPAAISTTPGRSEESRTTRREGPAFADPRTERAPPPVDRTATTRSSEVAAPAPPRLDGTTEPIPIASMGQASWRAPSTLRMDTTRPAVGSVEAASELLAHLPPDERPVASTDAATSATVASRRARRVGPLAGIAVGLVLTLATLGGVLFVVGAIRARLSSGEPGAVGAEPPGASPSPPPPPPPASEPTAAPTIPPPLDLPPPAAASAPTPTDQAPAPPSASVRAAPTASAHASPARPALPPSRAPRRLPSSGL